jgi:hypothetical protein
MCATDTFFCSLTVLTSLHIRIFKMAAKRARTEITDEQKERLVAEYDNGLKSSAGKENKSTIARLSAETGLSTTQITVGCSYVHILIFGGQIGT